MREKFVSLKIRYGIQFRSTESVSYSELGREKNVPMNKMLILRDEHWQLEATISKIFASFFKLIYHSIHDDIYIFCFSGCFGRWS